jgi:DNA-binding NarL/FixJ family response regulator
MSETNIKVIVFEDNNHLRESLYFLISSSNGFECGGAFPDTRQAVPLVQKLQPDVIVMDIEMPGMNGIDTTRLIKKEFPDARILILTVFEDQDKIFGSLCAGGSGYLLKNSTPEQILQAVIDVFKGGAPLSAAVAKLVVQFFTFNMPADATTDYQLTSKEKELLQQLVDGRSYKMIADVMSISFQTVKTHMKNIYKKLHVNSSTEAVAKAIKQKLV